MNVAFFLTYCFNTRPTNGAGQRVKTKDREPEDDETDEQTSSKITADKQTRMIRSAVSIKRISSSEMGS